MKFNVLHNENDADSRAFVEAHAGDANLLGVFNWYDPKERKRWAAISGTDAVSAFPAIVFDQPQFDQVIVVDAELRVLNPKRVERRVTSPARQAVVDWSTSTAEALREAKADPIALHLLQAQRREADASALAAVTWVEAVPPASVATEGAKAATFVAAAEFLATPNAAAARARLSAKMKP